MNRLKFVSIAVACLLFNPSAVVAKGKTVTVLAPVSCAEWVEGREEEKAVEPFKIRMLSIRNQFWLLGFVSGLNAGADGPNILESVDASLVFDWIDRYCAKNPKSDLFDGANRFLVDILRKGRK